MTRCSESFGDLEGSILTRGIRDRESKEVLSNQLTVARVTALASKNAMAKRETKQLIHILHVRKRDKHSHTPPPLKAQTAIGIAIGGAKSLFCWVLLEQEEHGEARRRSRTAVVEERHYRNDCVLDNNGLWIMRSLNGREQSPPSRQMPLERHL